MCCDFESPTIFEEKHITARKSHVCCECGSTIDPGEKYQHCRGLWDGSWATYKSCETCSSIRYKAMVFHECMLFGELYDCVGYGFEDT